jgi:hypothetical protein
MADGSRIVRVVARLHRPRAPVRGAQLAGALAAAAAIAIGLGVAAHGVSATLFQVDVLMPFLIGLGAGGIMAVVVRRLRLSRPLLAAGLAAAAAVGALAMQMEMDFRAARAAHAAHLDQVDRVQGAIGADTAAARARVRAAQMAEWTRTSYAAARIGIDDTGWFTGAPPVLGRAGSVAVSILEVVIAALCGWMMAGRAASEPACAACGQWRAERVLGEARSGVARDLVGRLLAGDDSAIGLLAPPDTRERVVLSLFECAAHDAGGGVLRVSDVRWTRRRRLLAARRVDDLEIDAATVTAIEERLRG